MHVCESQHHSCPCLGQNFPIPEANLCFQRLFTSFGVRTVISKFAPFCMSRFQSTFLPLLETEENSSLPSFSLSCPLQVCFCFSTRVAACLDSPKPFGKREEANKSKLAGEKTEKGGKAAPEVGGSDRANNGISVVATLGLLGCPRSQDMVPSHHRFGRQAPIQGFEGIRLEKICS